MQTKKMNYKAFTLDPDIKAEASISLGTEATHGDKIRALRRAQGMTTAELSRRTGLTSRGLRYIEKNEHIPTVDAIRRISAALGVTTDYFMDDEVFCQELKDDAFYIQVRRKYCSKGLARAKKIEEQTRMLFESNELSESNQLEFINEMEKILLARKEIKRD